ncbi:MAG: CusA/CzcA family heavy metal efflux RND transporter [Bacteroidia bacterium]|nr:CusA/CzcA family heavy metal efflux RND transporter [Bacteroidia bacterium]
MVSRIILFSIKNKFLIFFFVLVLVSFGIFSLTRINIGAVPDITNNQVQIITTSRNLSTQEMEQFITLPVELEMSNLPGVVEIRSISKFGLSVVTVVFQDNLGTYLPRQLIAEKIRSAQQNIPEGFGTPEMGPISTGLGEIYQYILDVEPEFKDKYTATDLRTIQDWIVKRQLSGIPGVVEVNTWGGSLKQYEIAINTEKLLAMDISVSEVVDALESNNSVSGGGYIEKVNQAYFVRGEGLVNSLADIENIVIKNVENTPIYIRNVAEVGFGSAPRFGAITGNGEGEKVLGQVMMLKNSNSKKVIEAVKARVAEISGSLPEGVYINPFLERSELINKTTLTVTENLLLGCLIVIFVVVLLLGNFRSGLIVASIIPLSLLFAIGMMYLFRIDANLMSLGAIDFGIIIDGAVIIIEFIAFHITRDSSKIEGLSPPEIKEFKNEMAYKGTSKMMNSAVFGQLIILMVFIPVLALSGVEGKMFRPMALTFSFALIGAIILCFTYIPVMASIYLKPTKAARLKISDTLFRHIQSVYSPMINWALERKTWVLGIAGVFLLLALFVFSRMGGEFVPTLDEGDFVIQPILKTGTSLSKTIETTTQIENILLDQFSEVDQVVTRIGAAEVPTDPMSMEETDVIITLNPKREWVNAKSKDELADKFKDALAVIPGMGVEFTQPIEMRFNELITGVRADIAIKIYGEDLTVLRTKADEIRDLIEGVEGAADITVEKVEGLPQMNVAFDRSKVARYGLNIKELNDLISMAFAGKTVGQVFEGERRFDMVLRLDKAHRSDLDDIKNLYVDIPQGGKVPLDELATISYKKGAAKISRDNTRRRIVVGINVRNRDLQSVVEEVRSMIDPNIQLPPGYSIAYGGQFENLQSAKARLAIAVPVALLLIFFWLYIAFKSVKEALIIYSAIPLAAVGGVFLLWIRDMPFSISAGVGFIALFGIAVLNGIVLIDHFKELRTQGFDSIEALIKQGTKDRLRAVLLTASAAALGFLPMAVSTNVGAEVQRPLATVVIGGLITATLLTLIVLPVLYSLFLGGQLSLSKVTKKMKQLPVIFLALASGIGYAQEGPKDLNALLDIALQNNQNLRAAALKVEEAEALTSSAFDFDKTSVYYGYDQNNRAINNEPISVFGVQQDLRFPTAYFSKSKLMRKEAALQQTAYQLEEMKVKKAVSSAYYSYLTAREKQTIYELLRDLYSQFAKASERRYELGETNHLERITARSKSKQVNLQAEQSILASQNAYSGLMALIQAEDSLVISELAPVRLALNEDAIMGSPELQLMQDQYSVAEQQVRLERQQLLPDISLEYFQGSNATLNDNLYGYQVGLKFPILFNKQASRIKASSIALDQTDAFIRDRQIRLQTKYKELMNQYDRYSKALDYYDAEGKELAEELLKTTEAYFKNGEIDFFQYIQSIENAYGLKLDHLEQLDRFNQTVIALNYLTF